MFDKEREALYRQYQEVSVKIVLLSLLDIAMSVRDKEPTARYIYITASDQESGGYWSTAITDADGEVLAESLEEYDMDDMETLGNLQDEDFASPAWKLLAEDNPTEDVSGEYRIDLDGVLKSINVADFSPEQTVWLLIITTRHGDSYELHTSETDARHTVHDFVVQYWDQDGPGQRGEARPEDPEEAIASYFEHAPEEDWTVESLTLPGSAQR